jgi:3-deoxy-D-manno-octulosonic-acid transferase
MTAGDPLRSLRRQLRLVQRHTLVSTLFFEPLRILVQGRQRWRWLLDHWGFYAGGSPRGGIWIHAAAAGEIRVAIAIVRALPETVPVVITTNREGRIVREALGGRAELVTLPFPFAFAVRRFLRHHAPRRLLLIEATDPRILAYLHMARWEIPTALVNGWLSRKWLDDRRDFVPLLDRVQLFGVRGEEDRELLAEIGIPRERITLTGDMKYDMAADPLPELEARLQELAGGRPILIAGSTHPDEEPQVLDAFERLGGGGRAMLIVAPRYSSYHLTEQLLVQRSLDFVRRSRLPASGRPAVVLLDETGELAALYRLSAAAFVGASLSPGGGGHNPLEPARFAVPVAVGPNQANFQFLADLFDRAGAWQRVADAEELARTWSAWLDDPELARQIGRRAADLLESQRGLAMAKTLELLRPFLSLEARGTV